MPFDQINAEGWPQNNVTFFWEDFTGIHPNHGEWHHGFCVYPKAEQSAHVFLLVQAGNGIINPHFFKFWPAFIDRLEELNCTFMGVCRALEGAVHEEGLNQWWGEDGPHPDPDEELRSHILRHGGAPHLPGGNFSRILAVSSDQFVGLDADGVANLINGIELEDE